MLDGVGVAVVPSNGNTAPICSDNDALIGGTSFPANAVVSFKESGLIACHSPLFWYRYKRCKHPIPGSQNGPDTKGDDRVGAIWGNAAPWDNGATLDSISAHPLHRRCSILLTVLISIYATSRRAPAWLRSANGRERSSRMYWRCRDHERGGTTC